MLLSGPVVLEDESGTVHVSRRPTTAVCRCGFSSTAPWCDGAHKNRRSRPPGTTGASETSEQ